MYASDIMSTNVISINPSTKVNEIASTLYENGISAVPVIDDSRQLVGMVSEGDLLRRHEIGTERKRSWWLALLTSQRQNADDYTKSHATSARDIMSKNVVTIGEDASLQEIANTLEKHHIKRVPVMRGDQLVGIVSRANLVQGLAVRGVHKIPVTSASSDRNAREHLMKTVREELGITLHRVNVIVEDGVVHLWGMVDTEEDRKAVRIAAENTPGVVKVDCQLMLFNTVPSYGI